MKNKKSFINNNVIKLVLVMVIALSSFSLFACKEEDPVITSSITVSGRFITSKFEVELTEENPNQTVTVDVIDLLSDNFNLITHYRFYKTNGEGTTPFYISDDGVTTENYRRINQVISYSYEGENGAMVEPYGRRSHSIFNHTMAHLTQANQKWDASTFLNENSKKHVLSYTIDKALFPEIYGNGPYEKRGINYSLTILVEDNSGDKEIDFVLPGATQVKEFYYDTTDHNNYIYTHDYTPRYYMIEKTSLEDGYIINLNAIDKETGSILATNELGSAVELDARRIIDDYCIHEHSDGAYVNTGFYVARLCYEGSETHEFKVEYAYIYVYESL